MKKVILFLFFGVSLLQSACAKSGDEGLKEILSSSKPPAGVVFEISSSDEEGLKWVVPLVKSYAKQLRSRYPKIKLAVVLHGEEQFQLTRGKKKNFADAHKQVANLVNKQGIDFHVCGNYAAMNGIDEEEFVDIIDVASRAPVQVRDYKAAGYQVLFIEEPDTN